MGKGPGCMESRSPVTATMLEPALLILLQKQAGHGYTLLGELETLGVSAVHPSVVYRTLREFETLEWVQSDWDTRQTQGPPRRTYALTALGQEALQSWRRELEKTRDLITHLLEQMDK